MSSDFYFRKWKATVQRLEKIVQSDIYYQETKAHDKTRCHAVQRLTTTLVQYMAVYNDALDCLKQNLQVQKTNLIEKILTTIVSRILELNHDLIKLEVSNCQFLSNALILNKLTIYDAELCELPFKYERSEQIQKAIEDAIERAKEKKESLIEEAEKQSNIDETKANISNWWDDEYSESNSLETNKIEEDESILSEESLKRKQMIDLIKAHEKSRQTLFRFIQLKQKRERWQKALEGNLKPLPPHKMRQKAAKFIQTVIRAYFECKRLNLKYRERDKILGLTMPKGLEFEALNKAAKVRELRSKLKKQYEQNWEISYEKMKMNFLNRNIDLIVEEYRDYIRGWLREWFDKIKYFHDIPNKKEGGSALIIKEEIPLPAKWLEDYEKYIEEKLANKGKTPQELKFEKLSVKREEMILKKQIAIEKKMEAALLKKLMKNPDMHPGYHYPESKKTKPILEAIVHYNSIWKDLDENNTVDVKERAVEAVDINIACTDVKLEAIAVADKDMRLELKKLKAALEEDYSRNGEKLLDPMRVKKRREKKKRAIKTTLTQNIVDQLEDLAFKGFLKACPDIKLQDFLGDPNFTGEEIRCNFEPAYPFNAEIRNIWWERCLDTNGFHKILLIGPKGNGKTSLVHALANMNGATLFELDLSLIPKEMIIAPYLQRITNSVAACARAVQPSIIHIKHVQRLFYIKIPASETDSNLNIVNTFWIKKLFRKIHKKDKITIIGTCIDPWLAKSKLLLKQFPTVLLLPNTTYSATVQLLQNWVSRHPLITEDFNVQSLAQVLKGYSYGYLKKSLQHFMSPERIVKIAVYGVSPEEVHKYIIEDQTEEKIDYEKYLKWYNEKTNCGKREQKHIEEQREFKTTMQELAEKAKKKKRPASATSSTHEIL